MRLKIALVVSVCTLLTVMSAGSGLATGPPASERDRVEAELASAPVVVVGVAGDALSRWENDNNIYTYTHVLVERVERGQAPSEITVRARGGTADGITEIVSHGVVLVEGERARLYLRPRGSDYQVVGAANGKQRLGGSNGGVSADGGTACDPRTPEDIPGNGFCRYEDLAKWFYIDQAAYYKINTANTEGFTATQVVNAVNAAFGAWENDGSSYIDFQYNSTTTGRSLAYNGTSVVYFRGGGQALGCGAATDVACAVAWRSASGRIEEFDIEINDPGYNFHLGAAAGAYDLQSIVTHEAGHTLGLGHPVDCNQVMGVQVVGSNVYGCIPQNSTARRALGGGDLNGVRGIYPRPWGPGLTSFEALGGVLASGSGVDAASWAPGRLDVFGRGPGNDLQHLWFSGTWRPWESLGAPSSGCPLNCATSLTSDPAAVSVASGLVDVFGRGPNNNLFQKSYNGTGWTGWTSLGAPTGGLASGPDAATSAGNMYVVARATTGGGVWMRTYNFTWSAWKSLGAPTVGATMDPSIVAWSGGRLDVFVRGGDQAVWHRYSNDSGTTWSAWETLGGAVTSSPDAASQDPGRLEIFARGTTNQVYRRAWNGLKWGPWASQGGALTGGPGAVSWSFNRTDLFVPGTDARVYHQWCCP